MLPTPKTREVWTGPSPSDPERKPGRRLIVVEVIDAEHVRVLAGSGSPNRQAKHWVVDVDTSAGLAAKMGLTKTTHFWHSAVHIVKTSTLGRQVGCCPYDEFETVAQIVWDFDRAKGK